MKKRLQFSDQEALNVLSTAEVALAKIAFKQLFDQHFTVIYRVALRFLESSDLAKEIAQEVFITIWNRRSDLVGIKSFEAYLRTSARNLVCDFLKMQAKCEAANGEHILRKQLNDEPFREEQYSGVLKLLEDLPPKPRQVFELAKVEGLSYEAIAERLKISPITVNHHMSIALRFIKERKYEVQAVHLAALLSIF